MISVLFTESVINLSIPKLHSHDKIRSAGSTETIKVKASNIMTYLI